MSKKAARNARSTSTALPQIDRKLIGERLRAARKDRGLTLAQLSERAGVAMSTISKAERAEIALTYDKFAALAHTLQIDFTEIFAQPGTVPARPITPAFTASGAQFVYDTPSYEYGMLAHELRGKRMIPVRAHVHARSLADFPDYIRHTGEEFVFLLRGALQLRFENGSTFTLGPGDSLYFDSSVGHVYLSLGDDDAEVLVCCVDTDTEREPDVL